MANLKSLAKDTAIYGLSSIIGRFLNYLLVPLYTAKMSAASGGYGVITNVYAYTALLLVLIGQDCYCPRILFVSIIPFGKLKSIFCYGFNSNDRK